MQTSPLSTELMEELNRFIHDDAPEAIRAEQLLLGKNADELEAEVRNALAEIRRII